MLLCFVLYLAQIYLAQLAMLRAYSWPYYQGLIGAVDPIVNKVSCMQVSYLPYLYQSAINLTQSLPTLKPKSNGSNMHYFILCQVKLITFYIINQYLILLIFFI